MVNIKKNNLKANKTKKVTCKKVTSKKVTCKKVTCKNVPGEKWVKITEGRDGAIFQKGNIIRKKFNSEKKAIKESTFLQILSGTGISPDFISQVGVDVTMEKSPGVTLDIYVSKMKKLGKTASKEIDVGLINIVNVLERMEVNPNDNNLLNYIVDETSDSIKRIDFGAGKRKPAHRTNYVLLMQKIHSVFPMFVEHMIPHVESIYPRFNPWREIFGMKEI